MVIVEMISTRANPSMTLPRNRNVGRLNVIDGAPTPTSQGCFRRKATSVNRETPEPMPKIKAESIKGGKLDRFHRGGPPRRPARARPELETPGFEAFAAEFPSCKVWPPCF